MKDSKEKEHRISNLKDMITNVKEDSNHESSDYEEIEEDSELIDYLNEDAVDYEELEIDDEYIYHPGDEESHASDLEENPIDENYIIKTPKPDDDDEDEEKDADEFEDELTGEISENFDNVIHAKIRGRPILAIVSSVLGVIFLVISAYIFQSRSDRIIDNVVAGETNFMFVIFFIVGLFLLIYGIFKLFSIKNPFKNITDSIDSIDSNKKEDKKDAAELPKEKPSPKVIPKSNIPLDKEKYKIGEYDMDDVKSPLKRPTSSKKDSKENEDIPQPKQKSLSDEEMEYEKAQLESESIDDIYAEVEDIDDIPIISVDSKEEK